MKILQITGSYKPAYVYGGPTRSVTALCERLSQEKEVQLKVLTTTANGSVELDVVTRRPINVDGVNVTYYRRWTGDNSHFSPGLLWSVFRQCKRFDAVHIHAWWNTVAVLSAMICVLRGIRPVVSPRGSLSAHTFQNNHIAIKRLMHKWIGEPLLKRVVIHITSPKESSEADLLVSSAKKILIPNLLDLPGQIRRNSSTTGVLRLLFVGRIHQIKNLELLFDALKQMHSDTKWALDIVGTGEEKYLRDLQRSTADFPQINWLGEMDGNAKHQLIAQSDLLILLSHTENFGNVVIEALNQGTAVLVSDQVGVCEYVREQNLGWVIDPEVSACVAVLDEIFHKPDLLEKIRDRAPICIRRDFSATNLAQKYISMYRQLTAS